MATFDDFLVNAKDIATTVGEKIGDGLDLAKLNCQKCKVQSEIKSEFKKLGELYYKATKEELDSVSYDSNIKDIDALYLQLHALEDKIAESKNLKRCPLCSSYVTKDSAFCPKCGGKF